MAGQGLFSVETCNNARNQASTSSVLVEQRPSGRGWQRRLSLVGSDGAVMTVIGRRVHVTVVDIAQKPLND